MRYAIIKRDCSFILRHGEQIHENNYHEFEDPLAMGYFAFISLHNTKEEAKKALAKVEAKGRILQDSVIKNKYMARIIFYELCEVDVADDVTDIEDIMMSLGDVWETSPFKFAAE